MRYLLALPISLLLLNPTAAQQGDNPKYVENFDGPAATAMLNGALLGDLDSDGPWQVTVKDGNLALTNETKSSAVHWIAVPTVIYGGTKTPATTAGGTIEAVLKVEGGLAGILLGDPVTEKYYAFAVGPNGNFLVAERTEKGIAPIAAGLDPAIAKGATNRISAIPNGRAIDFVVNGVVVVTVPSRLNRVGVGIVAIGLGTYLFDQVAITGKLTTPRPPAQPRPAKSCDLPPIGDNQRLILVGSYEGQLMSTVTVAGQDEETSSMTINIEPGSTPLYVLANSHEPMIYQITGETKRIARFVGIGDPNDDKVPAVGVVGLDPRLVSLLSSRDCFKYFYDDAGKSGTSNLVSGLLRHEVDVVVGDYDPLSVSLPSGNVVKVDSHMRPATPPGYDNGEWLEGIHFTPGGIATIDHASVVSVAKAEPYVVMPQEFGLAQLMDQGLIELRGNDFHIVKPIPRFPAGLAGAHSVPFVLGPGVPMPQGDRGIRRLRLLSWDQKVQDDFAS